MATKPTLKDIYDSRERVTPYINRTPLYHYPSLDTLLEAEVYVKHENHQRLGSFKIRGAVNIISHLRNEEKRRGVIVSSTGNFGQGIAFAARAFGIQSVIVMPKKANPDKVESMRQLGATLIFHGQDFDDAREHAEHLANEKGYRYIHSANEPLLTSGVGTYALEMIEDLPSLEVIIVPVGGGSGACGTCIATKGINPNIQVIGVQSTDACAAYLSWKENKIVQSTMGTIAEGLATRTGFEFTQKILHDMLDGFILVTDEELLKAVVLHLKLTHSLVEHAGAAPLAAAIKIKESLRGKKVALIASGGNISLRQLKSTLARN